MTDNPRDTVRALLRDTEELGEALSALIEAEDDVDFRRQPVFKILGELRKILLSEDSWPLPHDATNDGLLVEMAHVQKHIKELNERDDPPMMHIAMMSSMNHYLAALYQAWCGLSQIEAVLSIGGGRFE